VTTLRWSLACFISLLWAGGIAVADQAPHEAFANECLGDLSPAAAASLRVRTFGSTPESARRLVGYIADGEKSGTFTSPWLYEREPERTPVLGGLLVITDFTGLPVLLARTIELTDLTFQTVSEEHTAYDGPGARSLDAWRRIHWDFFTRTLAPHGLAPAMTMPVVLERFEVLCVAGGYR
jgi:uncharacterized protein YhfF